MTHEMEQKKKHTCLYVIIAFLAFLVLVQAGLLLNRRSRASSDTGFKALIAHQSNDTDSRLFSRPQARKPLPLDPDQDPFGSDPFMELEKMRSSMNRLFHTALAYGPSIANSLTGSQMFDFMPTVDLQETDKAYVIQCDLPGLQKDKINVTVRDNLLTIQGIRESESTKESDAGGFYAKERNYGSFARTINLPGPVDETQVKADYQNGVLTVTLPKIGDTKSVQKVTIQ